MRGIDELIFPAVVAHRGAPLSHPENTLPSFSAAVDAGADAVEFDVHLTVDGYAVVMHDADVSRTTGGRGLIEQLTFAQVRDLETAPGVGVPSLEETLAALSGRIGIDVEIKSPPDVPGGLGVARCVDEVVKLLDELPFDGPVVVSSFDADALAHLRRVRPDLPTGVLAAGAVGPEVMRHARHAGHRFVLPSVAAVEDAGAAFVRDCHEEGLGVGVWTVDEPERIERLFRWGVDAVVTNDPATAVPARDAARASGPQP